VAVRDLSANQREIKNSVDSISIKATEKAFEVYNISFSNMQTAFSIFVVAVCGIITLLTLL